MRRLLLRLYPRRWRDEYGAEFLDLLQARPLSARVVLDVAWSALRQRWRDAQPAQIVGSVLLLQMTTALTINVSFPLAYEYGSTKTSNWPVVVIMAFVGYWTVLRGGKPGRAAMKAQLTGTWPLILVGFLALIGALPILVIGPGDPPTTIFERGIALTYYDSLRRSPAPAGLMVLPILQLPFSGLYGWAGGLIARAQRRLTTRA